MTRISEPKPETLSSSQKKWIIAFMVFYLAPIVFYNLYPIFTEKDEPKQLRHYLRFLGLNQGFHLFAPEPIRLNSYTYAIITYDDASQNVWLKRLYGMPVAYQMSEYRYRKLLGENIVKSRHKALKPDIVRYLHDKYQLPTKKIREIKVMRCFSRISRPREKDGKLSYPEPQFLTGTILKTLYDKKKPVSRPDLFGVANPPPEPNLEELLPQPASEDKDNDL